MERRKAWLVGIPRKWGSHLPADEGDLAASGDVIGGEKVAVAGERGLPAVDHDERLAQAAEGDMELGAHALAEGHEQEDREGPPEEGERDERGPLAPLAIFAPKEPGQGQVHG